MKTTGGKADEDSANLPVLGESAATRLGMKLIIAGKVDKVDEAYFEAEIKPNIDGHQITFFGEADSEEKKELFANARCLLHPITWPEPFGLVMVEAMACGTPVIVFNRGAAPEVVRHGETGFVVETIGQMVEAIRMVDSIDPARCRQYAKANFDVPRMADDYVAVYERVLLEGKTNQTENSNSLSSRMF